MPEYDAEAEAVGEYLMAFVEAAGEVSPIFKSTAKEKLEEHLGELEPDGWYKLGDCAAALQDVRDEVGPKTITKGGVAAAGALPIEDDVELEEALELLKEIHAGEDHLRNSDLDAPAGQYVTDFHGDRSARFAVTDKWPLPESWAKGVYKGALNRWGPEDAAPVFEETTARADETAAWEVEW